MAFFHRGFNNCQLATICYAVCLVHLTVYHIGYGIGVYGEATVYHNILGRHRALQTAPSTKGMTLFYRGFNSLHLTAKDNAFRLVHFTIHDIGNGIAVHCETTVYRNILGRHRALQTAPSTKGVTLFYRGSDSFHLTSISNGLCLVQFSVYHIGDGIVVYIEATTYSDILGRHCL